MRNIVVLGMHRSGTSMVAGALASAGIYVGREEELLADQADNPHGFWERRDLVDLDEQMLLRSGGDWFLPPRALDPGPAIEQEIESLLARMPDDQSWLLKDPRMVLTWPLWQPLLDDPVVVYVYRGPLAVATSLQRRNGFPLALGLALWEFYNQRALDALEGHDVVSIAFEAVLLAPGKTLSPLLARLAELGVRCDDQSRQANVDPSLGKSAPDTELALESLLTDSQRQLAAYCQALCEGRPAPSRPPLDETLLPRIRDLASALEPLARVQETRLELEESVRLCEERTAERDTSLESLRQLEDEHQTLADAHREEVAGHKATELQLAVVQQKAEALFVELSNSYGKLLEFEQSFLARLWRFIARCYKLLSLRRGVRSGYDDVLADARDHVDRHSLADIEHEFGERRPPSKLTLARNVMSYVMRNPAGSVRSFSLPRLKRAASVFVNATPEDLGVWIDSRFPGADSGGVFTTDFTLDDSLDELRLIFPAVEQPRVSLIVPAYNEYRMTVRCLRSILENSGDAAYEVIIADDSSSDLTGSIGERIENIHHVRTGQNSHFIRNCNNAATEARGEFLLFLNNDTVVCPGWLQPLLDIAGADDNVGIVGSRLVYPDGRLQEAGGIMWRDGSAWNFGRMDDPARPAYNYVKEVDFVSGASLMIRADLWRQLGGFDERYCPAYYEDADIAFQAREAGYKVMYQPLSQVIHFEGVSHGTDLDSGIKQYQRDNQQKFREKWQAELDRFHFANADHVFQARDRSRDRRTVLYIDHYVPHYDNDAGSRSTFMYVQLMLEMGYRVLFMGANFFPHKPYTATLQQMGVEVLVGEHIARNQDRWLQENAPYIDRIYLHRPHVAEQFLNSLHRMKPRPEIIFFGCDLHYLRINREYRVVGDEQLRRDADKWRKREFAVFDRVDKIYYPSQVEVDEIQSHRQDLDIRAIPLYALPDVPAPDYDFKESSDILFVGGFNHPPNVDAVCWFVSEVLPRVSEQCPGVRLHVVGSNPTEAVAALQGEQVLVYGYLSDEELQALYRQVRLSVVPLRFGAGIKGKVLEAIQQNVPLVTTQVGAEGIPEADLVMNIADQAEAFADSVIAVYQGDSEVLARMENYQAWLQRNFSKANAAEIIRRDFGEPQREAG